MDRETYVQLDRIETKVETVGVLLERLFPEKVKAIKEQLAAEAKAAKEKA